MGSLRHSTDVPGHRESGPSKLFVSHGIPAQVPRTCDGGNAARSFLCLAKAGANITSIQVNVVQGAVAQKIPTANS